jgi:hypothetical protein
VPKGTAKATANHGKPLQANTSHCKPRQATASHGNHGNTSHGKPRQAMANHSKPRNHGKHKPPHDKPDVVWMQCMESTSAASVICKIVSWHATSACVWRSHSWPQTRIPFSSKSGIWKIAMAKLGRRDSSGASAIFHILRTRPAIFDVQLKRPSSTITQQEQPVPAVVAPPPPVVVVAA